MMLQGQNCSFILKVCLQKMICPDFLSAEELCNENPVVVYTSGINEKSAPVSVANDVRVIFLRWSIMTFVL